MTKSHHNRIVLIAVALCGIAVVAALVSIAWFTDLPAGVGAWWIAAKVMLSGKVLKTIGVAVLAVVAAIGYLRQRLRNRAETPDAGLPDAGSPADVATPDGGGASRPPSWSTATPDAGLANTSAPDDDAPRPPTWNTAPPDAGTPGDDAPRPPWSTATPDAGTPDDELPRPPYAGVAASDAAVPRVGAPNGEVDAVLSPRPTSGRGTGARMGR